MNAQQLAVPRQEQQECEAAGWEMKSIKPWHKQVASMLAQGIPRDDIAVIMDCTPEYVSMLARQPKIREYIRDLCQAADLQLEGLFVESVKAVGDVLANGNSKEKIQAARLQMEATRRIGPRHSDTSVQEDTVNRLARLAEKLLYLQGGTSQPTQPIIDGVIVDEADSQDGSQDEGSQGHGKWSHQSAQDDGDGLQDSKR